MPHERGLLPVPPSEFSCTTIADPKARFCCSPPASRHPSTGDPHIPLTLGHLNIALLFDPECLAQLWKSNRCVPFNSSQDAPYSVRHYLENPE